jgi:hypothetical protein
MSGKNTGWTAVRPSPLRHSEARRIVLAGVDRLGHDEPAAAREMRMHLLTEAEELPAVVALETRAVLSVLADLRAQGWSMRGVEDHIQLSAPTPGASMEERKAQVRAGHLIDRDAQLRDPTVRRFIMDMERRRLVGGAWHSIFSLMRDGLELAATLDACARLTDEDARVRAVTRVVEPYVQMVEPNVVCAYTGLRLTDIWRYFRHTWNTVYQSTPGRKLFFLVRDAAAVNHPVIGIGALGSSIVQLQGRDKWIGWHPTVFIRELKNRPTVAHAKWLHSALATLLADIFIDDFVKDGLFRRKNLQRPSEELIASLVKLAQKERAQHRLYPERNRHKAGAGRIDWKDLACMPLFRAKRALALADLLRARVALLDAGFSSPTQASLKRVLEDRKALAAIASVLRRVKASQVGVKMMDITVCGAVAPYNELLGGKLVSLLAASPDVVRAYERRYRKAASIIASSLKGAPVVRRPSLVLLGTTSLYDTATSQYNRLWMPANAAGGRNGDRLAFIPVGRTEGYGSFHFSEATMDAFDLLLARQQKGRQVNSIFGEGVNPKLRKVRAGLELVGLPSDALLQHGSPRLVFMVPLATNFREVLTGTAKRIRPIVPRTNEANQAIVDFWRQRWLSRRILLPEVLERVGRNTLTYPITHRARVPLPTMPGEDGPLFLQTVERPVTAAPLPHRNTERAAAP